MTPRWLLRRQVSMGLALGFNVDEMIAALGGDPEAVAAMVSEVVSANSSYYHARDHISYLRDEMDIRVRFLIAMRLNSRFWDDSKWKRSPLALKIRTCGVPVDQHGF